jgi:phenylpropionate dioxygenase-like ring-hydroxylating dioxygenase large terminal subunit
VANHQDFIRAEIAGRSILVQNFDGLLRGFYNVCSHRHARLRATDCGNGLLRCPYHGWTYNAEGVPVGIPGNSEYFGLDRDARQSLALRSVAVECCGDLVFARLASDGPDLATALGSGPWASRSIARPSPGPQTGRSASKARSKAIIST